MGSAGGRLREYHETTREPIYSFFLVLPFLLVYEVGLIIFRASGGRFLYFNSASGADAIVRRALGTSGAWASLLFLLALFAVWQWRRGKGWRAKPRLLAAMCAESILFALPLFALAMLLASGMLQAGPGTEAAGPAPGAAAEVVSSFASEVVLGCGAAIFEEVIFRLVLVSVLALVFVKLCGMGRIGGGLLGAALSAVLFSLAHGPEGAAFWRRFIFVAAAGLYLAVLFYFRCFGIAAGTHAFYNIMVAATKALAAANEFAGPEAGAAGDG